MRVSRSARAPARGAARREGAGGSVPRGRPVRGIEQRFARVGEITRALGTRKLVLLASSGWARTQGRTPDRSRSRPHAGCARRRNFGDQSSHRSREPRSPGRRLRKDESELFEQIARLLGSSGRQRARGQRGLAAQLVEGAVHGQGRGNAGQGRERRSIATRLYATVDVGPSARAARSELRQAPRSGIFRAAAARGVRRCRIPRRRDPAHIERRAVSHQVRRRTGGSR